MPSLNIGLLIQGLGGMAPLLATAIPLGVYNFLEAMSNVESASAAGDSYNLRSVLLADGTGAIVGSALGSPFPPAVYIGHPGWKEAGGRASYSMASGLFVAVLCFLGLFGVLSAVLPMPAIVPILLYIGLLIGAQAFQSTPRLHAAAVVAAIIPNLAAWGAGLIDNALAAAGTSAAELGEEALEAPGWSTTGCTSSARARRWPASCWARSSRSSWRSSCSAAIAAAVGAALCWIGLLHAEQVGWAAAPSVALGYLMLAAVLAGIGVLQRRRPVTEPVPEPEEVPAEALTAPTWRTLRAFHLSVGVSRLGGATGVAIPNYHTPPGGSPPPVVTRHQPEPSTKPRLEPTRWSAASATRRVEVVVNVADSGPQRIVAPMCASMPNSPLIVHVDIAVVPEPEAFLAATEENAAASRDEPGVVRFDVLSDPRRPQPCRPGRDLPRRGGRRGAQGDRALRTLAGHRGPDDGPTTRPAPGMSTRRRATRTGSRWTRFDLAVPADIRFGAGRSVRCAGPGRPRRQPGYWSSPAEAPPGRRTSGRADSAEAGSPPLTFAVATEPSIEVVREAVAHATEAHCDAVLGFGGGSALDVGQGRRRAGTTATGADPLDHLDGHRPRRPITEPGLPCIAVPTTAGTSSEVTRNAVLAGDGVKASLRSPLMLPRSAVVDPDLLVGVPQADARPAGWTRCPSSSSRCCPSARTRSATRWPGRIRRSARSFRQAYAEGMADPGVREDLALASPCRRICLANSGLGAVHGLAAAAGRRHPHRTARSAPPCSPPRWR